jgi:hypothetical protein
MKQINKAKRTQNVGKYAIEVYTEVKYRQQS